MALVVNAADRQQVERAGRKQKNKRDQELQDLRAMLQLAEGRRFIWTRLEKCNVFRSTWDASAKIHFNEGRRDVGLELMADIAAADENAFLLMMTEAQQRASQEKREQEALNLKEGSNGRRNNADGAD